MSILNYKSKPNQNNWQILFLLPILLPMGLFAQDFTKSANLGQIKEEGFHRVVLSPEIISAAKGNISSIRLFDMQNREVPFLITEEAPSYSKKLFREYEIYKKEFKQNCCTRLELKNPDLKTISNISLFIKNAETTKRAKLTGSDDGKNWFAIKERFYFSGINNPEGTMELKSIGFPPSNYAFYALTIDDSSSAPLNIIKAGFYETEHETGSYGKIPSLAFLQSDSNHLKKTFVEIEFPEMVLIDRLEFETEGPAYFLRNVKLMVKKERQLKKGKKQEYFETLHQISLNSSKPNSFNLPSLKVKKLYLEINNQDAPALALKEIRAFQLNRYLNAYLEKDGEYLLKIHEKGLPTPVYDLAFFKDSLPTDAPTIAITEFVEFDKKEKLSETTFFTNKNIIWAAIILVILGMGYMSLTMAREAGKKEDNI